TADAGVARLTGDTRVRARLGDGFGTGTLRPCGNTGDTPRRGAGQGAHQLSMGTMRSACRTEEGSHGNENHEPAVDLRKHRHPPYDRPSSARKLRSSSGPTPRDQLGNH